MKDPLKIDWEQFWNEYRKGEVRSEEDLFFQVGRTIDKKPIPRRVHDLMVRRIREMLELAPTDHLLDLCCGNGLATFELAQYVGHVTGVDFAVHLVEAARSLKARPNITYFCGDAKKPLSGFLDPSVRPEKVLMNAAMGYFDPEDFRAILANIMAHNQETGFLALFTDVPNKEWMLRFYNTPERLARYRENQKIPLNNNDGMGRWWSPLEMREIAETLGLGMTIHSQPEELADYRMDVLVSRK